MVLTSCGGYFGIKLKGWGARVVGNYPTKSVQSGSVAVEYEHADRRTDGRDGPVMRFLFAKMQKRMKGLEYTGGRDTWCKIYKKRRIPGGKGAFSFL